MTPKEAANLIDGNQYSKETTAEICRQLSEAGLVAVYGASDDLLCLEGAIADELGAWDGTTISVHADGSINHAVNPGVNITAHWDVGREHKSWSWYIEANIPNAAPFTIMEDDDHFCRGLVFALRDLPKTEPETTQWQPIETAPKDGTRFLAIGSVVAVMYWNRFANNETGGFVRANSCRRCGGMGYGGITHWMPLPTPPTEGEG